MGKGKHFAYCATPFGPGEGPEICKQFIERDLSRLAGARVDAPWVSNIEMFSDAVLREFGRGGPIDGLVIDFEGASPLALLVCDRGYLYEEISVLNAGRTLAGLKPCFAEGARVLLYSCRSGGGLPFLNVASAVSRTLGVEVDAPKKILVTPDNYRDVWGSQFALDADGRLSFNYENFGLYDRLRARWTDNRGTACCIAPLHYAEREGNILNSRPPAADNMFLRLRNP